ncbi:hypothetical protein [Pseudomonas sp. Marseille-P9899]|uniref:hypothetical protein n=1 Tax=Pseudomonas sp. Marseille-P9899 TaxID=2730401 RepID=UPI0015890474|nr:hypothetical protein [Pseudomonas sp. Marseille-P9899]
MEYLSYIVTFIAGLGTGWTLKVAITKISSRNSRNSSASQKGNTVGGDMAGGDIKKQTRR